MGYCEYWIFLYQKGNVKPWIYMCMERHVPNDMHNISTAGRVFHENLLCRITAHSDSQMMPIWDLRTELGMGAGTQQCLNQTFGPASILLLLSLSLSVCSCQKILLLEEPEGFCMWWSHLVSCTSMQYRAKRSEYEEHEVRPQASQWAQCDCFHLARVKGHKMRAVN